MVGIRHEGVMLSNDLVVVDFCSQLALSWKQAENLSFDLICGGPIYKCDDQTLHLIVGVPRQKSFKSHAVKRNVHAVCSCLRLM